MDEIKVVEYFESLWPFWPLGRPFRVYASGQHIVGLACHIQALQVVLLLVISPENEIREECIVLNPQQRVVVDRLVVSHVSSSRSDLSDANVLNLWLLRPEVSEDGRDPGEVCEEYLVNFLQKWRSSQEDFAAVMELVHRENGQENFLREFTWNPKLPGLRREY